MAEPFKNLIGREGVELAARHLRLAAAGQSMTSRQISSALDRHDAALPADQLPLFELDPSVKPN